MMCLIFLADLEENANIYWDKFYSQHQDAFFKDRHWLLTEFNELNLHKNSENPGTSNDCKVLEVGCGVGNTVFPLLQANRYLLLSLIYFLDE